MNYFEKLSRLYESVEVSDREKSSIDTVSGYERAIDLICGVNKDFGKIIFIGNGGSAAIASHQAVDYWKNGRIRAIAFNDASLLTCVGNDFGYSEVFAKPVEMFADPHDVLVAISSSGQSNNILNGASAARTKGCSVITLSGFKSDNPLRKLGDLNFYYPSTSYGLVEIAHLTLCHFWCDTIIARALGRNISDVEVAELTNVASRTTMGVI